MKDATLYVVDTNSARFEYSNLIDIQMVIHLTAFTLF